MGIGSYLLLGCFILAGVFVAGLVGAAIGSIFGHWMVGAGIAAGIALVLELCFIGLLSQMSM